RSGQQGQAPRPVASHRRRPRPLPGRGRRRGRGRLRGLAGGVRRPAPRAHGPRAGGGPGVLRCRLRRRRGRAETARVRPDEARTAYAGKLISVTLERWGEHEREIVEHPGAVVIVAVDADDRVALVRQLREATRRVLLELPAGTLEPGEDPLETAKRELAEETGLTG